MKVPLSIANRLLNPGEVVLVTSKLGEKSNIITIAWQSPLSRQPPLVGISVDKTRYSHKLISSAKEFVINIPTIELLEQVMECGRTSGKDTDKFKLTKLTPMNSQKLQIPRIKECVGWLECKLVNSVECGDHTLFVGEVIYAEADESLFENGHWKAENTKLIHHLGSDFYATLANLANII
jgi:flavin reductase (DIM6/NTAB) family NADH-FMN oxidoreductase RutF